MKTPYTSNKNMNKPHVSKPVDNVKAEQYAFYSKLLKEPFDTIAELKEAEEAYYTKLKAKEVKAAQKKADATKVEEAFKALNTARKSYKEDLTTLTKEYCDELENIKKAFELGKKDIHNRLAAAEEAYSVALKTFTDKYPEGYHLTLKDGDFETTISSKSSSSNKTDSTGFDKLSSIFDLMFNF